ncbi:two-component system OmpR family sensor kinase [Streptacidiphilus sp. MAP12-16]|uniref:sensor histidine kinase n=1 Tax=Streptacidiphilus sp. MAP12-16 TaxID=3156300 RepID=UPI0035118544
MRRFLPRTLRARLIAGLLLLLALACAAVGTATTVALHGFLVSKVDQQLVQSGSRYAASLEHGGSGAMPADTRGQSVGTFGARLAGGVVTQSAVVDGDADDVNSTADTVHLSADEQRKLRALPVDGSVHDLELSGFGGYRVRAEPGLDGDVLVTGMPLAGVEDAVHRLVMVELTVFGVAMVATGVAGALWVRLALRPLDRVAATAVRVTELPLASGAVALPTRVPDTDPGTEVGQVGAAFNRMLGHVEDALARRHASEERLRRFAADAGHELRTPLAAVRGHAELARLHPQPQAPEVARALERVQAESVRMGAIVDDLLLLARLDAGRPLDRQEVDLTVLVIDAASDARVAGPDHRWALELPEVPVTVTGDRDRLHQVLGNLLANARIHTPAGTTVTVRLSSSQDLVRLTVTDDGPGIPEQLRGELFERFTRGGGGRSRADGGSGLGLAIAHAVVSAHAGSLTVRSRPGHTEFSMELPSEPGGRSGVPARSEQSDQVADTDPVA